MTPRARRRRTRPGGSGRPARPSASDGSSARGSVPCTRSHPCPSRSRRSAPRQSRAERHTDPPAEQPAGAAGIAAGLQSRAERLVGAVLEGAEFSSESRPGPAELVELAVNVLRAAATAAGVPAEEVERQVAEALAYLRRRLTGDYVVDEFGFDEDYTVNVHLPAAAAALPEVVPGRGARHREHPRRGRRPRRGQPLRHHRDGLAHDPGRRLRRAPERTGTCGCSAPTSSSRCPSSARWPAAPARPWRPTPTPSGCSQTARSSASGPRASRASASRSASATSCSASAAAVSSRRPCAPACPIVPVLDRRGRGDLPDPRQHADRRPAARACPTPRSRRPSRCSGRSGMVPLPSKWLIEFGPPIETTELRPRGGR